MTKFTLTRLDNMKRELRKALPDVKNSHRIEAMARGLGWGKYASLLAKLNTGATVEVDANDAVFSSYLKSKGFFDFADDALSVALAHLSRGDQ